MSIYRIIDITPVGAYMDAMYAMRDSEKHDRYHTQKAKGPGIAMRIGRAINKSRKLVEVVIRRWTDRDLPRNAPEPAE